MTQIPLWAALMDAYRLDVYQNKVTTPHERMAMDPQTEPLVDLYGPLRGGCLGRQLLSSLPTFPQKATLSSWLVDAVKTWSIPPNAKLYRFIVGSMEGQPEVFVQEYGWDGALLSNWTGIKLPSEPASQALPTSRRR